MLKYNFFDVFFKISMDTVGKRLTKVIEIEADSLQDFCDKFDLVYNSIQPITTDKRVLGINILKKLIDKIPYLTSDWILFGKGEIQFNKYVENKQKTITLESVYEKDNDMFESTLLKYLEKESIKKSIKSIVEELHDEKKSKK